MNFSSDPIYTLENLIAKNKTKSVSIYLVLVLAILIFLIGLPIIKVDISSQSRGIVRSTTDNVPLSNRINRKAAFIYFKNNLMDKISYKKVLNKKTNNQEHSRFKKYTIRDYSFLVLNNP